MKRTFWGLPLLLCVLFAAYPAYSSTFFVATDGNDSNPGTIGSPFQTIGHAVDVVAAGDTIYVRGGTYAYTGSSTAITLPSKSGSSPTNRCSLMGYNGERPLLDFSAMTGTSADGLKINGSYWYIKGLDCKGAPHNGIKISGGSYNIVEFCTSYENRNTGVQLGGGAAYNQVINCDSYYNRDAGDGNADGFSPKLDVGTGNYFYGCRSWQNSDDGYDGYLRPSDDVTTTYENCWCFKNGYLKDGSASVGNGNGFKMGGSDDKTLKHNVILKNCLSFSNRVKGFDQNNDKGSMTLYNCTAFNNGGNNFSIATSPLATGKTARVTNGVYFTGSYSLGTFVVQTTNSWMSPFVVTSADFVSIDPSAAYGPRKADGSLPDITFMHLAAGSDLIDGGTDVGLPFNGIKPDLGCFETGGGSPPGAASSPVPSDGATNVGLTQDLSWTAGSGATSHDVYFGTTASPPFIVNQAGTTYDTGTMTPGVIYYWRIDEKNASGTTTGTVWSFTTLPLPGVASAPSPATGAEDVGITQDVSWTAGSGATSHDVYFGTASTPPFMANQTGTTYDTGTMTASITYYWRIDEKNAGGTTTGTVWSFTTVPPTPAQASSPVPSDGATNVDLTQDLSWTAGSGTISHDVYFGTVNPPPFIANQAGTTYDTGTMASFTTYYWRIDEKNAGGTTTGTIWSFATQDTNAPLPDPMAWAIVPAPTGIDSITMTAATATDASGVEYYFANVTDSSHDSGWQDGTVYTDTNLTPNTTYSYAVIARDKSTNQNETGWSDIVNATTLRYTCTSPIDSDLNGDCQVDLVDYARLADAWAGNPPDVDLNNDTKLDFYDIEQLAIDWLTCNRDPASECWQ